jgi:dihydrofolate reductase
MTSAKQAASDREVSVDGAAVAELPLAACVLDELALHVIPMLLGPGRQRFDRLDPGHIKLEHDR